MAEKISLNGDMRQGPTCVLVTYGFIQQIYKYMQEMKLQPFIQEFL